MDLDSIPHQYNHGRILTPRYIYVVCMAVMSCNIQLTDCPHRGAVLVGIAMQCLIVIVNPRFDIICKNLFIYSKCTRLDLNLKLDYY